MELKEKIEGLLRAHFGLTKVQTIKEAHISYLDNVEELVITGVIRTEAPLAVMIAAEAGHGLKARMAHVAKTTPAFKVQRSKGPKVKKESDNDEIIPGGNTASTAYDIPDNEIKKYIKAIQQRKWLKRLTENQIAAYENLKGNRIADLSNEQRSQYRDLYEETGSK